MVIFRGENTVKKRGEIMTDFFMGFLGGHPAFADGLLTMILAAKVSGYKTTQKHHDQDSTIFLGLLLLLANHETPAISRYTSMIPVFYPVRESQLSLQKLCPARSNFHTDLRTHTHGFPFVSLPRDA